MRASRLRSGVPFLVGLCLLSGRFLSARAQRAPTEPEAQCASVSDSSPNGLVVVIIDKPQTPSLDLRPLLNPCISGVALQIHWADLEPAQGRPDWTKLDQLFSAANAVHKWAQLLIFPGFFSPECALQGDVKTQSFAIQYGPGKGTLKTLPMPWNRVYLARWFAFLKLLSERYRNEPPFG
jgi:hypothetical protein